MLADAQKPPRVADYSLEFNGVEGFAERWRIGESFQFWSKFFSNRENPFPQVLRELLTKKLQVPHYQGDDSLARLVLGYVSPMKKLGMK